MIAEAAGECAPEFPEADIRKLQNDISRPDQFIVNFDYLARRVKRRQG
jgi:L-fuculose-phosphate aldolase